LDFVVVCQDFCFELLGISFSLLLGVLRARKKGRRRGRRERWQREKRQVVEVEREVERKHSFPHRTNALPFLRLFPFLTLSILGSARSCDSVLSSCSIGARNKSSSEGKSRVGARREAREHNSFADAESFPSSAAAARKKNKDKKHSRDEDRVLHQLF
jgi:hypothetical protein